MVQENVPAKAARRRGFAKSIMHKTAENESGRGSAVAELTETLISDQKFRVHIEGRDYEWDKVTITVLEIRKLGNIPHDQHVICEDDEGRERTLAEHETITIKHGHRHGRCPKYKRG